MAAGIIPIFLVAIVVLVIYIPFIVNSIQLRVADKQISARISQIGNHLILCSDAVIDTTPRGIGGSKNSDATFKDAHANHESAMSFISDILESYTQLR